MHPSLILTVSEPVARVDQAADGAAVPDLEPDEETHLGSVKVKGKEPELDEDEEDSSDDEDGLLLQLNAPKELLTKLCYWLVDNFEPRTCDLVLRDGGRLHVEAADVEVVLGLPNGNIRMERRKLSGLQEEFKRLFGNGQKNITANNVIDLMLTHTHGGVWFRRLFLIAMSTCLMDVTGNGYVPMGLLGNFDNVTSQGTLTGGSLL
ncbi:hypothetical protein CASFOL_001108 [Castilleja foliolosa]|uniref:HECT domain-containing protein n=1 Tax=Castilleja foliolosa TaxID=1961234 RepID=A0ABD3ELL9_9LAMI